MRLAPLCSARGFGERLEFFSGQPPCMVAMEARGSAHYWGREIGKLVCIRPRPQA